MKLLKKVYSVISVCSLAFSGLVLMRNLKKRKEKRLFFSAVDSMTKEDLRRAVINMAQ